MENIDFANLFGGLYALLGAIAFALFIIALCMFLNLGDEFKIKTYKNENKELKETICDLKYRIRWLESNYSRFLSEKECDILNVLHKGKKL